MTLERGLETEWTEICVAYAWYEECAGIATGDQFLITRKDGRMMIAGREQIAFQKFRELPDRPLEKGEFVEIVKKLRLFHGLAKSETAEVKAFESFPPEERKREIADYYKLTGRRYLESSKLYFWVRFDPNTDDKTTIRESFLNEMSADGYNNWVQTILKGLDAVP